MKHDEPFTPDQVDVELGAPVGFGGHDPAVVLRMAAVAVPPGSTDPVDRVLLAAAAEGGTVPTPSASLGYDAPSPQRPYAVSEVVDADGTRWRVARGEARVLVEQLARPSTPRHARAVMSKLALVSRAYHPLAVAVQRDDDTTWELLGYVPVRVWNHPERRRGRAFDYHMVWDVWLRLAHWSWVAAIVVLTVTGYFIADPGWVPSAWVSGDQVGYFMGYVRFIHLLAAVWLMMALVVRVWNLSTSRIPYDRWRALVPFHNRRQLGNTWRTLTAYLFVRPSTAPEYFGHNPLQQLTYTSVYVIFLLQVLTGMALWGLYDTHSLFWGSFQWVNELLGTQQTRLLHFMIMWVLILFLPLHVYLSIRADSVDRSGAISSMVSGGRWIRRGAEFEDWPPATGGVGADRATADELAELEVMHGEVREP